MLTFAMLGTQTIIIILVIALLVFGPQKLPDIGRQLGQAMRELRKMSGDMQRALDLDGHNSYDYYGSSSYESSASYSYTPPVSNDQPLDQYGLDGHYDQPKAIAEKGATDGADAASSAEAAPAAEGETPAKKPRRSRKTVADATSDAEAAPAAEGETPDEKPARRSRKKTPATETVAEATPTPADTTPAEATAVPSDVPTTPAA